jgi:hypothetical protein
MPCADISQYRISGRRLLRIRPACGPGRKGAVIVDPAVFRAGQEGRAHRSLHFKGDLPGPEPVRNGGRRLFSAAGEAPALHREAK